MDNTIYKRGADGKKVHKEMKTKSLKIKFKDEDIETEKSIYIGRNESYGIVVKDDPLVSRKHALIEKIKESYVIKDCGSTNGTYVNNNPVPPDGTELCAGDVIRVGKTELKLS